MEIIVPVRWSPLGRGVRIIDQRRLPATLVEEDLQSLDSVCEAIRTLAVRGAPALGVFGAMGLVAALEGADDLSGFSTADRMATAAAAIRATRPTAVNLPWALDRMLAVGTAALSNGSDLLSVLRAEATRIFEENWRMCEAIGVHGAPLVGEGARVMTHCNAGALATAGIGTALAPVYEAVRAGRHVTVVASETRPLLQGSRLTAWELTRAGIPVTVIADNMAAAVMRGGGVDLCIVGADRIAANGDVANKIGTYGLSVIARHHAVPFYVAAPSSTIDTATATGDGIVIEQRPESEVTGSANGVATVPSGASVYNPAFDVTPADLVTAIITEHGVFHPPYRF